MPFASLNPNYKSAQQINNQFAVCPSCNKRIRKDELTHGGHKCIRCTDDS